MAYVNQPNSWPFDPSGPLQTAQDVVAATAPVPAQPARWVGTPNPAFTTPYVATLSDIREGVGGMGATAVSAIEDVTDIWTKLSVVAKIGLGLGIGYVAGWMYRELRVENRPRRRRRGRRRAR